MKDDRSTMDVDGDCDNSNKDRSSSLPKDDCLVSLSSATTIGAAHLNDRDETDDDSRLRVYGMQKDTQERGTDMDSSMPQRISRELMRRQSTFNEKLPDSPRGWAALLSILGSAMVAYEVSLQKRLTCPPLVYGQTDTPGPLQGIYAQMTASPDSILLRTIQPSPVVGTRGILSSALAYFAGGPSRCDETNGTCFREVVTMAQDGAKIALDWELPLPEDLSLSLEQLKHQVLHGPIQQTVVIILHGISKSHLLRDDNITPNIPFHQYLLTGSQSNVSLITDNNANFGYIRSTMRACTRRGWLAVGFNFRGCGGQPLATPRGYNGAYTGDIRGVVQHISGKLQNGVKVFLVGNSLGANLVTKYLGEESLPKCIAGGVSLGNPLTIRSDRMNFLWSCIMALGAKRGVVENWATIRNMSDTMFRHRIRKAILAPTLHGFDSAMAPIFPRNDPEYPFAFGIGYDNEDAYWRDASSFLRAPHIPVPTMQLIAADDFLVFHASRARLRFCINNPNVLVVETKCGGHLGWQESPPNGGSFGMLGTSWSDVATTDFIAAVLDTSRESESLLMVGDREMDSKPESLRSRL
jgi:predicted alpha/beta-fold hydrolase